MTYSLILLLTACGSLDLHQADAPERARGDLDSGFDTGSGTGFGTTHTGDGTDTGTATDGSTDARLVLAPGRMTGGGSLFDGGDRTTHGFTLHCDYGEQPNNLEINWDGNSFHLTELTWAACWWDPSLNAENPTAQFNTYEGFGVGRLNGVDGTTIQFLFTDDGEPGSNDWGEWTLDGGTYSAGSYLTKGNHQAHAD